MLKQVITIGMAGAGRATELHMDAYKRVHGVTVRNKHIIAQRWEQVNEARERFGFEQASLDFNDLLEDPEIDVIDICTPPYVHVEMIEKAILAGKHVICEKPLSGYFGQADDCMPIGEKVSRQTMFERLITQIDALRLLVRQSGRKFMYAENFIYAPAIVKAAEIIREKKSRILFAKGEESLKGSSSPVAGEWDKTGGGSIIRVGIHPLSAILWLKHQEAKARGTTIEPMHVTADIGHITKTLSEYDHRHIAARPVDVEDFGTITITFSDQTKALVVATDTLLGGSKNIVELYCNDSAIECKMTLNDMMSTYFLDEDRLDHVSLSEMLPSKLGWNKPFVVDLVARGYVDEMQDFMEAIAFNREPESGIDLAYETIRIIYAAYLSDEAGQRICLSELKGSNSETITGKQ
jgi:predicted dehydrogenase